MQKKLGDVIEHRSEKKRSRKRV